MAVKRGPGAEEDPYGGTDRIKDSLAVLKSPFAEL